MARLRERYESEIRGKMQEKFSYENPMQIPRLHKIVINIGMGEAIQNPKALDAALSDLATISGQKPIVTKAKKSIAAFKVRQGMNIGCKVTLRGDRMYEFVDKLISAAIPRVRDFKGVSPHAFDGRGNYTLGLKEQLIFPEIEYDKVDRVRGMEVAFVTSATNDAECKELLRLMGMPFADK
ncbi:MAG: 50S ribosomal protein L5 [Firmicutes bacterium]|nr:50S ribosomal protein L5 [Bacillota bacterium]